MTIHWGSKDYLTLYAPHVWGGRWPRTSPWQLIFIQRTSLVCGPMENMAKKLLTPKVKLPVDTCSKDVQ